MGSFIFEKIHGSLSTSSSFIYLFINPYVLAKSFWPIFWPKERKKKKQSTAHFIGQGKIDFWIKSFSEIKVQHHSNRYQREKSITTKKTCFRAKFQLKFQIPIYLDSSKS